MGQKFDRQMATVQNLEIPPYPYKLIEYRVEEWAGNHVCVTRSYSQTEHKTAWHDCISIGPRGGTKTIYKNFY